MKSARPPGPRGMPILGELNAFRRDPARFLVGLAREYGDVVRFRLGSREVTLLAHPDHVRDVLLTHARKVTKSRGLERAKPIVGEGLLTSEGALHLRQRRLCQPAFRKQRLGGYSAVMVDHGQRLRKSWEEGPIDMANAMMRVTMGIVAETLFGANVEAQANAIGENLEVALEWQSRMFLPFFDLLRKLPLPSNRRFKKAMAYLDGTIHRLIQERRGQEGGGDLLSILLHARDDEDGKGMSETQLRDELMTIFLAGHQTVADALTWTWYLLSQNPQAEAALHEEIDQVLEGRLPTVEDAERLPYTRKVFAESMRRYPPAWLLGRLTTCDYEVAGYVLPPGSTIFASAYVIHNDPRFYPNPERFDPERWNPEVAAERPKFSYFPFGGGTRICIGEPFAWLEGILLLAILAQEWRVELAPGHRVEMAPRLTLGPKHGLPMTLKRRRTLKPAASS